MKRTFEIKLTITTNSDFAASEVMKIKNEILSGELKRRMTQPGKGFIKAIATFKEIK